MLVWSKHYILKTANCKNLILFVCCVQNPAAHSDFKFFCFQQCFVDYACMCTLFLLFVSMLHVEFGDVWNHQMIRAKKHRTCVQCAVDLVCFESKNTHNIWSCNKCTPNNTSHAKPNCKIRFCGKCALNIMHGIWKYWLWLYNVCTLDVKITQQRGLKLPITNSGNIHKVCSGFYWAVWFIEITQWYKN